MTVPLSLRSSDSASYRQIHTLCVHTPMTKESRLVYLLACLCANLAEQCLQSTNDQSLPSFQDYEGEGQRIPRFHQAIIPSYEFQCCGNVTEWRVDVHCADSQDNRRYNLNLQVWRPSPTVRNPLRTGYYNLVGNNRFTSISLSAGGVRVTPSPEDYIPFRSRDVLGFYVEEARDDNGGIVALTTDSYTSEIAWHASVASQLGDCSVSVGSNGGQLNTLLRGAPVIEIDTSELINISTVLLLIPHYRYFSSNIQLSYDHTHPSTMSYNTPSNYNYSNRSTYNCN